LEVDDVAVENDKAGQRRGRHGTLECRMARGSGVVER